MSPPPPAPPVVDAVELLERAVAYACGTLATVTPTALPRPTPCSDWPLAALLVHMEDSLDAFTEAAAGTVDLLPRRPTVPGDVLGAVRSKATALLGAWTSAPRYGARPVALGDHALPADVVAALAALEIGVHGWDVGRAAGLGAVLPPALALDLEPWAHRLVVEDLQASVGAAPRHRRFAPALEDAAGADPATRLLGRLGRRA